MPLLRRIISAGITSRSIILPKTWLKYYEDKHGMRIEQVEIETDGETLHVSLHIPRSTDTTTKVKNDE